MLHRDEHFVDFVAQGFDFGFGGRIGDGQGEGLDAVGGQRDAKGSFFPIGFSEAVSYIWAGFPEAGFEARFRRAGARGASWCLPGGYSHC